MPVVHQDIDATAAFYAGEDKVITLTVSPVQDIGTWTFLFQVRLAPDHPNTMLEYTTGSGIVVLLPSTNGQATVTIPSADWALIKPGNFAYGYARTNTGHWDVQAEGLFVINPSAVHHP